VTYPLVTRTDRAPQPARKTTYASEVDIKTEIRDFVTSRRARITPEEVGITSFGQRRVPGLRREEVATLAGLSIEYYNRLERGNLGGASETVLDALADALRLDDAERAHLFDLARASQPASRKPTRRATTSNVRPTVQWMLDSMTNAAAFASNGQLDVLSANQLGRALYAPMFRDGPQSANWARFVFLNRGAHEIYTDWDRAAKETVALLRLQAGSNPNDRALTDLIGELATQSEEFRVLWAAHNVRLHTKGVKRLNHPIVGELELHYDRLDLMADRLMLFVYTAGRERGRQSRCSCLRAGPRQRQRVSLRAIRPLAAPAPIHASARKEHA
jgi:transcriptional regulator with XRE-family HTH domain